MRALVRRLGIMYIQEDAALLAFCFFKELTLMPMAKSSFEVQNVQRNKGSHQR